VTGNNRVLDGVVALNDRIIRVVCNGDVHVHHAEIIAGDDADVIPLLFRNVYGIAYSLPL
jgi:hypothetical protein